MFVGGGSGALMRHLASFGAKAFVVETLYVTALINVVGSICFGCLQSRINHPDLRLLVFPGLLGGFTTFSAFSAETIALMNEGRYVFAAGYIGLSVGFSLVGFALAVALSAR